MTSMCNLCLIYWIRCDLRWSQSHFKFGTIATMPLLQSKSPNWLWQRMVLPPARPTPRRNDNTHTHTPTLFLNVSATRFLRVVGTGRCTPRRYSLQFPRLKWMRNMLCNRSNTHKRIANMCATAWSLRHTHTIPCFGHAARYP
jgi:hypothetical protein